MTRRSGKEGRIYWTVSCVHEHDDTDNTTKMIVVVLVTKPGHQPRQQKFSWWIHQNDYHAEHAHEQLLDKDHYSAMRMEEATDWLLKEMDKYNKERI